MVHKLMARTFFTDPQHTPDYNAGYAQGWQDCLRAIKEKEERKAAHKFQNSQQWLNLQAKLEKKTNE